MWAILRDAVKLAWVLWRERPRPAKVNDSRNDPRWTERRGGF